MTSKTTWKSFEQQIACLHGTFRNPLSGQNSRGDRGSTRPGDVIHDKICFEAKLRSSIAIFRWWEELEKDAKRHNRIPLLWMREKGNRKRVLVAMDSMLWWQIYLFLIEKGFDFDNVKELDFMDVVTQIRSEMGDREQSLSEEELADIVRKLGIM